VLQLLVTANVVPSSPILVTLMMEALRFSETLAITRATRGNVPEDGVQSSHCNQEMPYYPCSGNFPRAQFINVPWKRMEVWLHTVFIWTLHGRSAQIHVPASLLLRKRTLHRTELGTGFMKPAIDLNSVERKQTGNRTYIPQMFLLALFGFHR
jgi:hypothetical protein